MDKNISNALQKDFEDFFLESFKDQWLTAHKQLGLVEQQAMQAFAAKYQDSVHLQVGTHIVEALVISLLCWQGPVLLPVLKSGANSKPLTGCHSLNSVMYQSKLGRLQ